ncbi:MAG: hypothetical protein ACREQ5_06135 [Candidatus Dormibacteria bacterium]
MNPQAVTLWNTTAFGAPLEFTAFFANVGGVGGVILRTLPAIIDIATVSTIQSETGQDLSILTHVIPAAGKFCAYNKGILTALDATSANYVTLQAGPDNADAVAVTASSLRFFTVARNTLFNGVSWDRAFSASAANQAAQPKVGVAVVTGPGNWTLVNAPVAATQATATRAAGAAGVRHVLTSINASINATAAQGQVSVVVRDGATGVGTIIWEDRLSAVIGTDSRVSLSGLNIVGSAATAMTVEFTAAPAATNFETVSATGYDC